jgi:hypothetical protein
MRTRSISLVAAFAGGCSMQATTEAWGTHGSGGVAGGGSQGSAKDGGAGSGGHGSSGSSGSSGPGGGGSSGGAGSSSGTGSSGGSSGSSGGSGGGSGSSGGSSGSSGGQGACTYPSGPYGITQGAIVDPSLSWQGYLPGGTTVATLQATDLYDCDKSKGINAIVFDESAVWCGSCQQEAQDLEPQMASTWKAEGVAFVTLMGQDEASNPATTQTAGNWRSAYGLTDVAVVADPNLTFLQSTGGLPTNVLVDPRTMKIVSSTEGYGGPDPAVDQLAQQNK